MRTGCFFEVSNLGRVSIARSAPRTYRNYKVYKPLQPGTWFRSVDYDEYYRLYQEILAKLDPQKCWDEIHELTGNDEPTLLCWERTPLTVSNWCHRRMVAHWFEEKLGHVVPEANQGNIDAQGKATAQLGMALS